LEKPWWKSPGSRARNVFILVVLFGPADDSVLNDLLNDRTDFGLGKRNIYDQAHAVVDSVLFDGRPWQRDYGPGQDHTDVPQFHVSSSGKTRRDSA
jgi:hypothetical protein